jgi:5-methylthioadenosine/S-adenosylhomocysteine deaminase
VDLEALRNKTATTLEHLQSTLGKEAWAQGMNPDIPETKILDNPYMYTDYGTAATHSQ